MLSNVFTRICDFMNIQETINKEYLERIEYLESRIKYLEDLLHDLINK